MKSVFYHNGRPYSFDKVHKQMRGNYARIMPAVAEVAVNFFQDRFRAQAWTDRSTKRWDKRKTADKNKRRRAILIKSGQLRNAISPEIVTKNMVQIINRKPYASVHNQGFRGVQYVRAHHRKIRGRVDVYNISSRKRSTRKTTLGRAQVKAHSRRVNIPQRQFMGNSEAMERKFDRLIVTLLDKSFNM
jgi:phage gpG-like protein